MDKKTSLIAFSIFVVFFLIFLLFPSFLITLESRIFDSFTNLIRNSSYYFPDLNHSKHVKDIVIVIVDEETVLKVKKKLPFPRYLFADLLKRIYKGGPKLVVFDIVFAGESENKQDDILLAEAIGNRNDVLFPYATDDVGRALGSDKFFLKNLPNSGYINKPLDKDSVVRRFKPMIFSSGNNIRDFATELYVFSAYYDYPLRSITSDRKRVDLRNFKPAKEHGFKKFNFSLLRDKTMWLRYNTDRIDFKKIPMWVVLDDNFDASVLNNKIVFVGVTAKVMHDIHNTPFGLMPGVQIMANAALMFLDGNFIDESPFWLKWLVIFLLCFFVIFLCYRLPVLKGFLFIVSLVSIIMAVTLWLFANNYYLNPFKLILICVISYVAINFYKYTFVVLENMNLRKISTTDELTGLHTFRFFQVVIEHEFHKCLRYKTPVSLFMIDIDNFKKINDNYGHQNGNVTLKRIGEIILNNARKSDFPVRYGGEELAVLLPHTETDGAYKCAETIRQLIEKEDFFMTKEGPKKVTVSIGISSFPSMDITSVEDMIKFADTALYKAKHEGKNRVVIYSEEAPKSIDAS